MRKKKKKNRELQKKKKKYNEKTLPTKNTVQVMYMILIIWTAEMKSSEGWSSQLWTWKWRMQVPGTYEPTIDLLPTSVAS